MDDLVQREYPQNQSGIGVGSWAQKPAVSLKQPHPIVYRRWPSFSCRRCSRLEQSAWSCHFRTFRIAVFRLRLKTHLFNISYPSPLWLYSARVDAYLLWTLVLPYLLTSPVHLSVCLRPGQDLQYACPLWHYRLTVARSKALEFLQKRALNVIIPGSEYATNLITANVEALSHDDGYSHSFSSEVMSLGAWPLGPPCGSATGLRPMLRPRAQWI